MEVSWPPGFHECGMFPAAVGPFREISGVRPQGKNALALRLAPGHIRRVRWQIITGEYPPRIGGVSDYTRAVAGALAAAGDAVEVWTGPLPPASETGGAPPPDDAGVTVHRLPDHFGRRGLAALGAALDDSAPDARVLVQYEPWSYGWRGMNVPFCLWLWRRRRRLDITTLFHEVATDIGWKLRFKQNVLGFVTLTMAGLAVRASRRAFVTIPAWETLLRPLAGKKKSIAPLPVPSNMPRHVDPERLRARRVDLLTRAGLGGENGLLIGHFGTFRGPVAEMLGELLRTVLRRDNVGAVLVGRGSEEFARQFAQQTGDAALSGRVVAAGSISEEAVSEHLAAVDLLAQPYPDGISARRTSTMASLALGQAIVTNDGELTEPFWRETDAVRLVATTSPAAMAEAVLALLDDPAERARLCAAATAMYEERFDIARLVAALRAQD
jgi:glycosyltransferase involved in cell wall biosynthesis